MGVLMVVLLSQSLKSTFLGEKKIYRGTEGSIGRENFYPLKRIMLLPKNLTIFFW